MLKMEQTKVGNLISKLRKKYNLTQTELGEKIGVSPKTISKWECGKGMPDIIFLKKISEIFNITTDELLDGELIQKENNPKNLKKVIIPIIIITILIIITNLIIVKSKNKQQKPPEEDKNCTIIRTYYIDNIGKSNNDNYLYITIHEFQVEGTYTIKLPKLISKHLEVGNNYEFTFKTNEKYLNKKTDILFQNAEVTNLEYTEKLGNEIVSKYECN